MRANLPFVCLLKRSELSQDATALLSCYTHICNVLPSAELILFHTAPQTDASRIVPNLALSLTSKVAP